MRPAAGRADWARIIKCYDRAAAQSTALPVRPDEQCEELRTATYQYVHDGGEPGSLDAYALFNHREIPGGWRYTIAIRDWAATSAAGLQALVGFVAGHGSLGKDATFHGGSPEPWSLLVGEQHVRVDGGMFWMARGLDLAQAVAHRGFPPGLSAKATVAVDDQLLPRAHGPWRLEVADGRGVLEPASTAAVRLDARAVGPLYTGFRDPAQLALAGLVSGPPAELALLAAAFAGPPPLLVDFF
jgi:predicted acetyltransferase